MFPCGRKRERTQREIRDRQKTEIKDREFPCSLKKNQTHHMIIHIIFYRLLHFHDVIDSCEKPLGKIISEKNYQNNFIN